MGPGVSGPWATYLAQGLGLLRRTAASVGRIGVRQCQFRYHGAGFVIGHGLLLTMGYPAAPEVFFVGGAFEGARSAEVMAELFLHQFGVKRLAPGRITTLPPDLPSASATFAYDATRLAGCAGAPIIDFQRGQALGVHVGQDAAGGNLGQATCHLITELRLAGAAHF